MTRSLAQTTFGLYGMYQIQSDVLIKAYQKVLRALKSKKIKSSVTALPPQKKFPKVLQSAGTKWQNLFSWKMKPLSKCSPSRWSKNDSKMTSWQLQNKFYKKLMWPQTHREQHQHLHNAAHDDHHEDAYEHRFQGMSIVNLLPWSHEHAMIFQKWSWGCEPPELVLRQSKASRLQASSTRVSFSRASTFVVPPSRTMILHVQSLPDRPELIFVHIPKAFLSFQNS